MSNDPARIFRRADLLEGAAPFAGPLPEAPHPTFAPVVKSPEPTAKDREKSARIVDNLSGMASNAYDRRSAVGDIAQSLADEREACAKIADAAAVKPAGRGHDGHAAISGRVVAARIASTIRGAR